MPLSARIEGLLAPLRNADSVDLVSRLALLLVAFSEHVSGSGGPWTLILRALAIAGLAIPGLHRAAPLWLGVFAAMACRSVSHWWTQDNHLFLFTYLSLALWLSLRGDDAAAQLREHARWLLGSSFALAVLQKLVLSDDFMTDDYFTYTFLADARFDDFSSLVGVDSATLQQNLTAEKRLTQALGQRLDVPLLGVADVQPVANLATLWTVGVEGCLAIAFLWPRARRLEDARHGLLLLFVSTTYLLVGLISFGWVLLLLGTAQCGKDQPRWRVGYAAVFALLLVYTYLPPLSWLRAVAS